MYRNLALGYGLALRNAQPKNQKSGLIAALCVWVQILELSSVKAVQLDKMAFRFPLPFPVE